ncbi:MAG: PVC-type heme-binding CxxCH protein [Pirellulales bacterium]
MTIARATSHRRTHSVFAVCHGRLDHWCLPRSWPATAILILALTASVARAQRDLKVIPDPDPELERQSFEIADGLEVNLYAADPRLAKPIHINFDARGRLWVASSEVYPHVKPGQKADDKILVLEDSDGDGRAEKTTVFADGLLIPTGVLPGDGGAYVANSTEILHLVDTDGDGRADKRRVMLSGFGTEDTHHIIHTFRWGPDGMVYFNQSIYIHSHVETPWGVRRLNSGGVWQFRPETMRLTVFARGLCNPWGHVFDRWGQSFATDGAGGEGINYVFPGATLFTYAGATKILNGLNPGSPKHCGLEVISGRHFPDDWQGNLVTNDFRAHRVCRFVPAEAGSGYSAREQTEIIKTRHAAFRPVDVKMGPDGALYIADWYNPIIQHGEVDFRDERRDHTHGRIWRVTAKARPLAKRPQFATASVDELLAMLAAPEEFTRTHAKHELKARGTGEVIPKLAAWLGHLDPADPEFEHLRLEALWTYQSLDVAEPEFVATLAGSTDSHVRAAAARVLSAWHDRVPQAPALLARLVADPHPQVRLEAVRALALLGTSQAAEVALRALDQPMDRFLDHALWLTVRELQPFWLGELEAGRLDFGGNARDLAYALAAAGSPRVAVPLVNLLESGKLPPERRESVLLLIAALGGPPQLRVVLDTALRGQLPAASRAALLKALAEATRMRKVQPAGDPSAISGLLDDEDLALRLAAIEAAGLWHIESLGDKLLELGAGGDTPDVVRQSALASLAALGPQRSESLRALCGRGQPAKIRAMAVAALAALDVTAAAGQFAEFLADEPAADPGPIVLAILDRQGGAPALTEAVSGRQFSADAVKLAIRAVRSAAREEPRLAAALAAAGGIATPKRTLSPDELAAFVADVASQGNPARGEAVFRRGEQACLKCHAIAGAGGRVGPDLVSIGTSAQVDYLVESVLEPSAKIKENYHSLTVVADGLITSGVKVRETDAELVLRDGEDREVAIALDAIEGKQEGGSIMPVGLADELTRSELVDLVRFLSELGKVGPYAVGNARVARRWQTLLPTPEAIARFTGGAAVQPDDLGDLTWTSAYGTVSGQLPPASIPVIGPSHDAGPRVVRCELDVAAGGKVDLVPSGPVERIWLDAIPLELANKVTVDVSPGVHTILIFLGDQADRDVRLELADAPGSAAQAQFVGGK